MYKVLGHTIILHKIKKAVYKMDDKLKMVLPFLTMSGHKC